MIRRKIDNFNLEQICKSGQCFRMKPEAAEGLRYSLITGDKYLEVDQQGNACIFYCDEEEFESFWKEYFDLERDYAECISQINPRDT